VRTVAIRTAEALAAAALVAGLWEGYKVVGDPDGTIILGARVLPRADDLAMPHLGTIVTRLFDPEFAGGPAVWTVVASAIGVTLGEVAVGFTLGAVVGVLLAVLMQRLRIIERGLLPYVIISQTVPLVALAPAIAGWGGVMSLGPYPWQPWMSVAVIASYLAFFPIAVGVLRGLQSPSPIEEELMRSYGASWWRTLLVLRFPSSRPYLWTAMTLAAAAAVVGAVVGEISTGTRGGVGRLLLEYSRSATSDPAKVYTAMIGVAVLGLVVTGLITAGERLATPAVLRGGTKA
jgi:NitT/TauT family transport system permease protein